MKSLRKLELEMIAMTVLYQRNGTPCMFPALSCSSRKFTFGRNVTGSARVEASSRESMTYRVRDSKARNGNSSTCLQHVWPPSKEVGKRTGNNRHGRKFIRVVRTEALACRQARYRAQKSPLSPITLIVDTCSQDWLMSLDCWIMWLLSSRHSWLWV